MIKVQSYSYWSKKKLFLFFYQIVICKHGRRIVSSTNIFNLLQIKIKCDSVQKEKDFRWEVTGRRHKEQLLLENQGQASALATVDYLLEQKQ